MSAFSVPVMPVGSAATSGTIRWSEVEGIVLDQGTLPDDLAAQLRDAAERPISVPVGGTDNLDIMDDVDWVDVLPGSSREAALAWCAGLGAHDAVASFGLLVEGGA